MRTLIKKILSESLDGKQGKLIKYIASNLEPPYLRNIKDEIETYNLSGYETYIIFSQIFGVDIGDITKLSIYDIDNNIIYWENPNGEEWITHEYGEQGEILNSEHGSSPEIDTNF